MSIKIRKIYYLTLMLSTFCIKANFNYQDTLVNNIIVSSGAYPCEKRYKAIKPFLDKFKRPFTVLDIGAAQGYFSFKTAYDYEHAVAVMIEQDHYYTPKDNQPGYYILEKVCQQNSNLNNVVFLKNLMTIEDLQKLSLCEHFDVIYALNVVHHFGNRCKEAFDAIASLGDYVIVELPSYAPDDLKEYVASKAPQILGIFDRPGTKGTTGTMRLYHKNKNFIALKSYDYPVSAKNCIYKINSNFEKKKLIKLNEKGQVVSERNWEPGINFCTFKVFNGIWPDKALLKDSLNFIASEFTSSIFPYDIIIQGNKFKVIKGKSNFNINSKACFSRILNLINLKIERKDAKLLYIGS